MLLSQISYLYLWANRCSCPLLQPLQELSSLDLEFCIPPAGSHAAMPNANSKSRMCNGDGWRLGSLLSRTELVPALALFGPRQSSVQNHSPREPPTIILRFLQDIIAHGLLVKPLYYQGLFPPWQQNSPRRSSTLKATYSWYTLHVLLREAPAYTCAIRRSNLFSVSPTNLPARTLRLCKSTSNERTKISYQP